MVKYEPRCTYQIYVREVEFLFWKFNRYLWDDIVASAYYDYAKVKFYRQKNNENDNYIS